MSLALLNVTDMNGGDEVHPNLFLCDIFLCDFIYLCGSFCAVYEIEYDFFMNEKKNPRKTAQI